MGNDGKKKPLSTNEMFKFAVDVTRIIIDVIKLVLMLRGF